MQMWTMIFRGRRYGPYPWWVMRWIFNAMKATQGRTRQCAGK